jgi:hypothetical protein
VLALGKKDSVNNQGSPNVDSPRANLADIPRIDDMLALYEKVLSEIDADIATQQKFIKDS